MAHTLHSTILESTIFTQKILFALPFCAIAFCVSFFAVFLLIRFSKKHTILADSLMDRDSYPNPISTPISNPLANPITKSSRADSLDFAKKLACVFSPFSTRPSSHYPTPKAGGVGIILGVCAVFLGAGLYVHFTFYMLGGFIVFLSGFIKDMGFRFGLKVCVFLQCVGVFLSLLGLDIWLKSLGLGFELPYIGGLMLSIVLIVGLCNAVNLIDKFNGLSGGFVLCVSLSIMSVAMSVDILSLAIISAILGSAVLGFLVLNFPSGRVFLGSGGAYFLGYCLAMILVILTQTSYSIVSPWYALCVVIYPVWEMLFLFFRRKILEKKDSLPFHTLLFRRLGSNPLTSLLMLCAQIPFIALATLFYANSLALAMTCAVFVVIYTMMYNKFVAQ
ncbi:MraY family glycosyltransferase [Helicobacter sp. MIT 01-3238]|uniref:MraY family glycosyltransferase n=1 Tax=Helicobacter sp. MIT 01-3238 TaxID=398627 RepID=UPI000E1E377D|nr:MraY family glycosyltransferase [Helicobacter sp. MIT 01-3238]RDU55137.1 hypothetical protein CQA40_01535 [Helicobacter sp. MIT 01-3238]